MSRPETDYSLQFDVHAIDYLRSKGIPPTDDLPKYSYSSDEFGNYSKIHVHVQVKGASSGYMYMYIYL